MIERARPEGAYTIAPGYPGCSFGNTDAAVNFVPGP